MGSLYLHVCCILRGKLFGLERRRTAYTSTFGNGSPNGLLRTLQLKNNNVINAKTMNVCMQRYVRVEGSAQ